jgi:hypothetical protein
MLAHMALGHHPRPLVMRLRSRWGSLHEFLAELVGVALLAVFPLLLLMMLGLAVRGLSELVGTPLPYVHDDPNRVEWDGLAELVGYGIAGALALYVLYMLGERLLPVVARRHIARMIGVGVLFGLAMAGVVAAIDDWDVRAAAFALACGYGAFRVAFGLPLNGGDGEDHADGPETSSEG